MDMQASTLFSPLSGKIVKILAREGELVEEGQEVFVVESLKMHHTLQAARRGYLGQMTVQEGDIVSANYQLACVV